LNRTELIKKIQEDTGAARTEVVAILNSFEENILKTLNSGDNIKPWDMGTFKVADSPARTGRNPRTGEQIPIAASRKLKFVPANKHKKLEMS